MPADVDDGADSVRVLDHDGSVVFHCVVMHHVRELARDSQRLAKKKIQNIDAVRGDVEERAASGFGGIDQPTAAALAVKPHVVRDFGQNGLADRAGGEQLLRALHLWIRAAIVGHAEGLAALFGSSNHGAGLGLVHGHGLFAEHVLARAQGLNRLRCVEKDWRADVDGVNFGISKSFVESSPDAHAVRNRPSRDRE